MGAYHKAPTIVSINKYFLFEIRPSIYGAEREAEFCPFEST